MDSAGMAEVGISNDKRLKKRMQVEELRLISDP